MLGRATLSGFAVLLTGLVVTLAASAAFRGNPGGIAFDLWEGQSMDIGVLHENGSRLNLTNTPLVSEQTPRWSRDGSRIVFMLRPEPFAVPPRPPDIWVMNADGSRRTRLTETALGEFVPAWTPDGRIVFCGNSGDAGGAEIYVMNADGTERTRLTNSPGLDCWPAPAPNGNRLSFTSERNGNTQIFTMKLDGSDVQQVTTGEPTTGLPIGRRRETTSSSSGRASPIPQTPTSGWPIATAAANNRSPRTAQTDRRRSRLGRPTDARSCSGASSPQGSTTSSRSTR